MAQGKALDRAKVAGVVADLALNAESQAKIAGRHGVSEGTVRNIRRRYLDDFDRLKNAAPEGELIAPLATNLLVKSLVTLTIQMEQFGDKDWLAQQSAGELAVLYGVLNDKTVRLLAAMQRAELPAQDVPRGRTERARAPQQTG